MRMTDARLDRVAAAWHREFDAWDMHRDNRWKITRREQVGGHADDSVDTVTIHTLALKTDRFDAEAWLNTYRNRAAARAALSAADGAKP